jgi:phage shock protein A
MDAETLKLALQATNMMGTFALGIWLYLEKRGDKTNDRVTDLSVKVEKLDKDLGGLAGLIHSAPNQADLASHAERLARIEEAVRRSPSHEDLKGVHTRLDGIATKTDTMQGQLPGLIDNVRLILNILKKG